MRALGGGSARRRRLQCRVQSYDLFPGCFAFVCVCVVFQSLLDRCAKGFKMRGNTRRVLALAWARVCLACMCVFCVRVRVRCGMWMGVLDFEGGERERGEREQNGDRT